MISLFCRIASNAGMQLLFQEFFTPLWRSCVTKFGNLIHTRRYTCSWSIYTKSVSIILGAFSVQTSCIRTNLICLGPSGSVQIFDINWNLAQSHFWRITRRNDDNLSLMPHFLTRRWACQLLLPCIIKPPSFSYQFETVLQFNASADTASAGVNVHFPIRAPLLCRP